MWLLPLFSRVAAFATRTFYRTTIIGGEIPRDGPLLLAGNHPNSLLDPLFLAAVARRPVRFLAKAPLFSNPWTSWAVTAVGAIPVYRPRDNPALVQQNENMFRAAYDALLAGAAVGIFPEGMSHDAPSIAPLRTGAARIALGARSRLGAVFPIIPVGLVLRNKEEFRSGAHVLVGEPVRWDDIAGTEDSPEAVKELTARIDRSLRAVTLNLEQWQDSALLAAAEAVFVAELGAGPESGTQVDRWREAARLLFTARHEGDTEAVDLAREIRRHARALDLFGLEPADLHAQTDLRVAARWSVSRITLPLQVAVAWAGALLFWAPYRLTAVVVNLASPDGASRASVKLVAGGALFILWIALLAAVAWIVAGWMAGIAALLLLPLLALATLGLLETADDAWSDARRFFLLRSRTRRLDELRRRQAELARRLGTLRDRLVRDPRLSL
ncbi:MAG: lysophospholipid acyltransferase family protein [Gemmatimonadaceae bacterium]